MQVRTVQETLMQRDFDLMRELLLYVEANTQLDGTRWIQFTPEELGMPDKSPEELGYHVTLLVENKYLLGQSWGGSIPAISRLTWEGHEFLDSVRDPDVWTSTKQRIKGLAGVALPVVVAIAQAEIKKRLGLP